MSRLEVRLVVIPNSLALLLERKGFSKVLLVECYLPDT